MMRFGFILLILSLSLQAKPRLIVLKGKNPRPYAPVTHFFNIGYDTGQNRTVFDQASMNYSRVFKYMFNPSQYIRRDGGLDKLIDDEFFGKGALSNYPLHMIGGGFNFRYLYEWFSIKNYPMPWLAAFLTAYAGNITNEALETSYDELNSHDHLADLYFFDLIGKLMFTSDAIASLFFDTFGMRSWDGMPMLDLQEKKIYNASLNYFIRSSSGAIRPMVVWGMYQMGGVSIELTKNFFLSPVLGVFWFDPLELSYKISSAVFLDYNDNLIASLHINGAEDNEIKLALYPGIFADKINIGVMLSRTDSKEFGFGITLHTPIGFGRSRTFR